MKLTTILLFALQLPALYLFAQNNITSVQSPDKKIKFSSREETSGGSWHHIESFAEFKVDGNKKITRQLNTGGDDFTDSEIYKVYEIRESQKVYYVTFGWGTHGGGAQHQIIRVFRIEGDKLIQCKVFDKGETELVIEYPRTQKLNLQFDEKANAISFDEFAEAELSQYKTKTGKRIRLTFRNSKFN